MSDMIPYGSQWLDEDDIAAVVEIADDIFGDLAVFWIKIAERKLLVELVYQGGDGGDAIFLWLAIDFPVGIVFGALAIVGPSVELVVEDLVPIDFVHILRQVLFFLDTLFFLLGLLFFLILELLQRLFEQRVKLELLLNLQLQLQRRHLQ